MSSGPKHGNFGSLQVSALAHHPNRHGFSSAPTNSKPGPPWDACSRWPGRTPGRPTASPISCSPGRMPRKTAGMTTGLVHQPILSPAQLASLQASPEEQPFDGDATKFKLGVEALRLGIAYEYDPYFSCLL